MLLNGDSGGPTDNLTVQQRLAGQLGAVFGTEIVDAHAHPLLAEVVRWKGDAVAGVDVSLQVNRSDIQRAALRSRSGAHVIAFVIGAHWATDETREEAQRQQVEWKVGSDLSAGFLAVRTR
jgi:hypothetical protein